MKYIFILVIISLLVLSGLYLKRFFQLILPDKVVCANHKYIHYLRLLIFSLAGVIFTTECILSFFVESSTLQTINVNLLVIMALVAGLWMMRIMKGSRWQYVSIALFCLFLVGVGYSMFGTSFSDKTDTITVSEDRIGIKGSYPIDIPVSDISDVILEQDFPGITLRTNGMSFMGRRLGYFKLKNGEKCYMSLRNELTPVIHIKRKNDIPVFLNSSSPDETIALYEAIENVRME